MNKRTALVTGASGFIGSHLARLLLAEGWQVHGILRNEPSPALLPALGKGLVTHLHDGTTEAILAIMAEVQPTVVFHLASLFLSEHQPNNLTSLIQSNLLFGTQVIEAMARTGTCQLVNTGTFWQHYEGREYSPVNLYAATKQAFETLLQYYVEACGLRVITLKLFDSYGPGDPRPKLMNLLKRVAAENHPMAMSPGDQMIDLVHVEDVAQAFLLAAERLLAGEIQGHERYAVSSNQALTLKELVALYETILGRRLPIEWGKRPYRAREVMNPHGYQANWLPHWQPRVKLDLGLQQIIDAAATP